MTIVGSVLENMDMERLISGDFTPTAVGSEKLMQEEIGVEVAQRIKQKGESMESVEEVAQYVECSATANQSLTYVQRVARTIAIAKRADATGSTGRGLCPVRNFQEECPDLDECPIHHRCRRRH